MGMETQEADATPNSAEATTRATVSAEKILHTRILIEVESVNQPEAAEAAGIGDRTYREHCHDRTDAWLEADRMFAETVRPLLVSLAAGRAARIIKTGADGPAAQLIIRILGLTDHVQHGGDLNINHVGKLRPETRQSAIEDLEATEDPQADDA